MEVNGSFELPKTASVERRSSHCAIIGARRGPFENVKDPEKYWAVMSANAKVETLSPISQKIQKTKHDDGTTSPTDPFDVVADFAPLLL